MIITPVRTRIFKERENLSDFIVSNFKTLAEKSIVVVTSKVVALSEGRTAVAETIKAKEKLIKK